jgi:ribosome maturation factor RimP
MGTIERVRDLALPVCEADGVELVDVELEGGVLRLTVARDGGLDLDAIAGLTRRISRLLDDDDPVPGRYTLEVSTPGLERRLRTPAHFGRAVGELVNVRTTPGTDPRRVKGTLTAADDETVSIRPEGGSDDDVVTVRYEQVERARTVFEWGPTPKKGGPKGSRPGTPSPSAKQKAAKP